jgi:hypothetical protein
MDPEDSLPLAFVIVGSAASVVLYLSPIPLIIAIVRSGAVGMARPDSFIIGVSYSLANGAYPAITGQFVPVITSSIALLLYSVYLTLFLLFAGDKRRQFLVRWVLFFLFSMVVLFSGPVVVWSIQPDYLKPVGGVQYFVSMWFGVCACVANILLLSGQMTSIRQVVRDRDSSSIDGIMLAGGTLCSLCWTTYGCLILDPFYMTGTITGDIVCFVQIFVKVYFRKQKCITSNPAAQVIAGDI